MPLTTSREPCCPQDRSGFWGPWTYAENGFSNDYFKFLLEKKWTVKTTHNGKPYTGKKQYEADDGQLMMLPTDMALIWDPEFKKVLLRRDRTVASALCPRLHPKLLCDSLAFGLCLPVWQWVEYYAKDEEVFFKDFAKAWQKLTELGCTF